MTDKKTCQNCPFFDESAGWCNFTKSEQVHPKMPECEARKAYRVLRNEVRRLRNMVDKLEFCGWSHSCSGQDCCPCCRAPMKYDIPRGHHINHYDDCVFTNPTKDLTSNV